MSEEEAPRQRTRAPKAEKVEKTGLAKLVDEAGKRWGQTAIQHATATPGFTYVESGIFLLDFALLGGTLESQVTTVFGNQSAGKSTLAARFVANSQRKYRNKSGVVVDFEQTFDNTWGAKHGVDLDRLLVARPESGEAGVDMVEALVKEDEVSIIVIDSLPAIVPLKMAETSAEDNDMPGLRARLVGRMCSKILKARNEVVAEGRIPPTIIFINQWREKIGVMHGDPRQLPCGKQPRFLAGVEIEIKNKEVLGKGANDVEIVTKNEHAFAIKKCKGGNGLRQGEFTMIRDPAHPLGEGSIDEAATVATYARKFGLITGSGGAWRINGYDDMVLRKLEDITAFFLSDEEAYLDIKRRIIMSQRVSMGLRALPPDGWLLGGYVEQA